MRLNSSLDSFAGMGASSATLANSRAPMSRMVFEMIPSFGLENPNALGSADDIQLCYFDNRAQKYRNLDPFEYCSTCNQESAPWKEDGIFEKRPQILFQLHALVAVKKASCGAPK